MPDLSQTRANRHVEGLVIYQSNTSLYATSTCVGVRGVPSLRHHSNVNIYTKNMHATFMYIFPSVVCMRESEISRSVIIVCVPQSVC